MSAYDSNGQASSPDPFPCPIVNRSLRVVYGSQTH
jgi:hypothetical protein